MLVRRPDVRPHWHSRERTVVGHTLRDGCKRAVSKDTHLLQNGSVIGVGGGDPVTRVKFRRIAHILLSFIAVDRLLFSGWLGRRLSGRLFFDEGFRHFSHRLGFIAGNRHRDLLLSHKIDDGASFRIDDGGELRADLDASLITFHFHRDVLVLSAAAVDCLNEGEVRPRGSKNNENGREKTQRFHKEVASRMWCNWQACGIASRPGAVDLDDSRHVLKKLGNRVGARQLRPARA